MTLAADLQANHFRSLGCIYNPEDIRGCQLAAACAGRPCSGKRGPCIMHRWPCCMPQFLPHWLMGGNASRCGAAICFHAACSPGQARGPPGGKARPVGACPDALHGGWYARVHLPQQRPLTALTALPAETDEELGLTDGVTVRLHRFKPGEPQVGPQGQQGQQGMLSLRQRRAGRHLPAPGAPGASRPRPCRLPPGRLRPAPRCWASATA